MFSSRRTKFASKWRENVASKESFQSLYLIIGRPTLATIPQLLFCRLIGEVGLPPVSPLLQILQYTETHTGTGNNKPTLSAGARRLPIDVSYEVNPRPLCPCKQFHARNKRARGADLTSFFDDGNGSLRARAFAAASRLDGNCAKRARLPL